MKRTLTVIVIICWAAISIQAQKIPMALIKEFKEGIGLDRILFLESVSHGSSPISLTFFDGRKLWVGENSRAKIFDLSKKDNINQVDYPFSPKGGLDNGNNTILTVNHIYLNTNGLVSYGFSRSPISISAPTYNMEIKPSSRFFSIRDYVFFYDDKGLAVAIDSKGNLFSNEATKTLLLDWLKTSWCRSSDERTFIEKMIESGTYVIIDGIVYPRNMNHLYEYFVKKGVAISTALSELKENDDIPGGVSLIGQVYISMGANYGVYVVDQSGEVSAVIDNGPVSLTRTDPRFAPDKPGAENISGTLYSVHPNGDLYALYAIKGEVARLYKATKTWGIDYLSLARIGMSAAEADTMKTKLEVFSSVELKIIRNTLMALHGYAFKNKDLSDYFLGYSWYSPDTTVKNDTAILSADQKRLFDVVVAIEKERIVAP